MHWRLGVYLTYIQGTTKIVADALSCCSQLEDLNFHTVALDTDLAEDLFLNKRADNTLIYPLDFVVMIDKAPKNDKDVFTL